MENERAAVTLDDCSSISETVLDSYTEGSNLVFCYYHIMTNF
ncbi:Uncharacterised protein [Legionella moravica]|uniref:Uncharacterized protein n=1 Tax=Legionella moravica TaxID=39962 RepID=A0A378JUT4_9GAMM|nr:Uncharacterised protein [Legionella moravica]